MNKKRYIYRDGKPRATECQFSHYMDKRSTGLYGSGIYAFKDKDVAERYCRKKDQCYKIDVTDLNLYKPDNLDDLIDVGAMTARIIRKEDENISLKDIKETAEAANLSFGEVWNGIEDAKYCIHKKEDYSRLKCSMPINYILENYDGVEPQGKAANQNSFGIVIFKEAAERMLGEDIRCIDNIEGIGEKF